MINRMTDLANRTWYGLRVVVDPVAVPLLVLALVGTAMLTGFVLPFLSAAWFGSLAAEVFLAGFLAWYAEAAE